MRDAKGGDSQDERGATTTSADGRTTGTRQIAYRVPRVVGRAGLRTAFSTVLDRAPCLWGFGWTTHRASQCRTACTTSLTTPVCGQNGKPRAACFGPGTDRVELLVHFARPRTAAIGLAHAAV